eukprot:7377211-Prymnesium_polylepis.2
MHRDDRPDRFVVPLYSLGAGVVLRPSATRILCAYGLDGSIDHNGMEAGACQQSGAPEDCVPGCGNPPRWCDPNNWLVSGWCRCGFDWCSGAPQPYRPQDLGTFLEMHAQYGKEYQGVGTYSGYNEVNECRLLSAGTQFLTHSTNRTRTPNAWQVIVDGDHWSRHLPHAIEAFFFTEGGHVAWRSYVEQVHAGFLACFQLDADHVPLLKFQPEAWDEPFVTVA